MTGVDRRRAEIGRCVFKVMGMRREGSGTLVPKDHVIYISVGCPCPSCRVQLEGSGKSEFSKREFPAFSHTGVSSSLFLACSQPEGLSETHSSVGRVTWEQSAPLLLPERSCLLEIPVIKVCAFRPHPG